VQQRLKSSLILILKLSIAFGLIFWLIHSGKLEFKSLIQLLRWQYLIPCMACTGLSLLIASERWRKLLLAQNIQMTPLLTFKLTLIGTFFNFMFPGGVGGDVVRGFYITKINHQAKTGAALSVFMDRLIGLYVMILIALVAMLFFPQTFERVELKTTFIFLLVVFLVYTFCWFLLLSKRFHQKQWIQNPKFFKLYESSIIYQNHKKLFFEALILSAISQIFAFTFLIFAGYGLGYTEIPVDVYFLVAPLGYILIALPISIAGIGVGQAAFLFLFDLVLRTKTQLGPSTITAYQVSLFLYGLMGSYFYISFKKQI
jgi:uncharacterized protein (TIRG00374 family)